MVPVEVTVSESFDVLCHREFAGLVRLAMVLVDNQEQAEEVVQDAFAALYMKCQLVSTPLAYVRASVLDGRRKVLRRRALARRYPSQPVADGELIRAVMEYHGHDFHPRLDRCARTKRPTADECSSLLVQLVVDVPGSPEGESDEDEGPWPSDGDRPTLKFRSAHERRSLCLAKAGLVGDGGWFRRSLHSSFRSACPVRQQRASQRCDGPRSSCC
jgi:DNA-directed RNA polymerase specialized sigma24 family protein